MARISNDQRMATLHQEAMREFDNIQGAVRDERLQCLQDRRFATIAGATWEGPLGSQFESKPKFEVNKIALAITRIINEYRNNRVTVDFISKDGTDATSLAETCNKLYRADEQDSMAVEAYDNAFDEAVTGGMGAYRLRACYEDEEDDENEHQRIRIEPIYDADSSVFFDINAKRQDKADAKSCYVLTSMTPDAYRDEYDDDPATWPKDVEQTGFDWSTPDVVYVAEYYRVEHKNEVVRVFQAIDGTEERYTEADFENDPELEVTLSAIGSVEVRQKKVKRKKIHKYILSGGKVLEDCGYIAGNCIPIVPVYGKRWFIDNIERCMGVVRFAKDPQRLKNMQLSKLGEISALSSVEKPIFVPEQVVKHSVMWSQDNIKNYPYLLVDPVTGADGSQQVVGPVAYTKSPQIPPAMAALLQLTETDIADILGNQQNGDKIVSNISGKAVEMVQQRLDMQAFLYMNNHNKAVQRGGEIWLSMAREIYVEPRRRMKGVGVQNEVESIEIMRPVLDRNGEVVMENDLSQAKFDVVATLGPSSSSQRSATVRSLLGMLQLTQDPQTQQVLLAMAFQNMEGEGISDVRAYFRKQMVQMGVMKPNPEEAEQMAAQAAQQDPNAAFLEAAAEEALAKAAKARADVVGTVANSELTRAKTLETISKIDTDQTRVALELVQSIGLPEQAPPRPKL
ncbi:MAG: hypothetical protein AN487_19585 [Anabaena sp. CRKS33]|nr:hypothetical protein [Burkholderiales bacterium]OBQ33791.1 MAG: hypothetical protein AN487_19585 [Anabaena sp. CRKS33]